MKRTKIKVRHILSFGAVGNSGALLAFLRRIPIEESVFLTPDQMMTEQTNELKVIYAD